MVFLAFLRALRYAHSVQRSPSRTQGGWSPPDASCSSRELSLSAGAGLSWRLRVRGSLLALAVLLGSPLAMADPSKVPSEVPWNHAEIETARSAALGDATIALGDVAGAVWSNPAALGFTRVYHVEGFARYSPEAQQQSYGAAIADSSGSSMNVLGALGIAYTAQDPSGIDRKDTVIRAALAYPISDRFIVGVSGTYAKLFQDGVGPFGYSYASGGLQKSAILSDVSFDAGLGIKLTEGLRLGVLGKNLTNPNTSFLPMTVGGGLAYVTGLFSLGADGVADFTTYERTTWRGMGGGEFLVADIIPLRAGYRYDDGAKTHTVSGGLGYLDPSFGIFASVERVVSGTAYTAFLLSVQLYPNFNSQTQGVGTDPGPSVGPIPGTSQ